MNKFNWYFKQLVTEGHMDTAFDNAEQADRDITSDFGFLGITVGIDVTAGTGAKELDVTAGTAYDSSGRRCRLPAPETVTVATDVDGAPITNPGVGNELWVGLFIRFKLELSNPATDGGGAEVQFNVDEGYELILRQGSEVGAGLGVPPAAGPGEIRCMDIRLDNATSVFGPGNLDDTDRQFAFIADDGTNVVRAGQISAFATNLLTFFTGTTGAAGVGFVNTGIPAGWTNLGAATAVQTALDGVADDLDDSAAVATCGAARVGFATGSTWADASALSGTDSQAVIDEIVADLGTKVAGAGANLVGIDNTTAFTNYSVQQAIAELDTDWGKLNRANTWTASQIVDGGNFTVKSGTLKNLAPGAGEANVEWDRAEATVGGSATNAVIVADLTGGYLGTADVVAIEGLAHFRRTSSVVEAQTVKFVLMVARTSTAPTVVHTNNFKLMEVDPGGGDATNLLTNTGPLTAGKVTLNVNGVAATGAVELRIASTGIGDSVECMVTWRLMSSSVI